MNLDYFSGGVPPLAYFVLRVDAIKTLILNSKDEIGDAELCIIGLASYFEAYCKDQFAAIINLCPQVSVEFVSKRECKISARSFIEHIEVLPQKFGFLIAEEYDFGSAKAINALFCDLLTITPFSSDEMVIYADFLNDRNLLVHHGGVYTTKYVRDKFSASQIPALAHYYGLSLHKHDIEKWADFILNIGVKLAKASKAALLSFISVNKINVGVDEMDSIAVLDTK